MKIISLIVDISFDLSPPYWRCRPSPRSATKFVVSGFHARRRYGDRCCVVMHVERCGWGFRFNAFTLEVRTRINTASTLHAGNVTRLILRYRTQGELNQQHVDTVHILSIEHQKPIYVLSHAKLVLDLFHAFTQDIPYRRRRDTYKTKPRS